MRATPPSPSSPVPSRLGQGAVYTERNARRGGGWGVGGCACACAKELRVCDARDVAVTDSARMGGETLTWCAKNSDVGVVVSYIY